MDSHLKKFLWFGQTQLLRFTLNAFSTGTEVPLHDLSRQPRARAAGSLRFSVSKDPFVHCVNPWGKHPHQVGERYPLSLWKRGITPSRFLSPLLQKVEPTYERRSLTELSPRKRKESVGVCVAVCTQTPLPTLIAEAPWRTLGHGEPGRVSAVAPPAGHPAGCGFAEEQGLNAPGGASERRVEQRWVCKLRSSAVGNRHRVGKCHGR